MRIISPKVEIIDNLNGEEILKKIEKIGRVCYKSEDNIKEESAERFVRNIINSGHESVIEHVSISVRVICDRSTSHQWVRHRLASYSQESQRYCNYNKDKFGNELTFVDLNTFADLSDNNIAIEELERIESLYMTLIKEGVKPEDARSILPNCTKTEFICTMNLRGWRHFFEMRCDNHAQHQIRYLAKSLLKKMSVYIPIVFDDLREKFLLK